MSGKILLVTGVTGFIAGHVANQFLEKGYRVRGTTRGRKIQTLKDTIKVPGLEFVQIDDVATGDFTEALKDVYAVIHVASPLPGVTSVDDTLNSAIEGTLNILRQADKAGIEKVVVTSSIAAVLDVTFSTAFTGLKLTDSDWGNVTREQAQEKAGDPRYVYFASKILAEKALWQFAKEHPSLDIATILPAFVYGPFADHFPLPSKAALGTNKIPYNLITGAIPSVHPPWVSDVRDVAKAHVLALALPRKPLEEKRFLISTDNFTLKQAGQHLKKTRPNAKIADLNSFPNLPGTPSTFDTTRAKEVLKFGDFITPQKTFEDVTDSLLELEKIWSA